MMRVIIMLLALLSHAAHAAPDPDAIVRAADAARGGGLPGIQWQVLVQARDGDKLTEQRLAIKADGDNALVEYLAPRELADQKLLMVGRNMWFIREGLRRPVPISPRQRLLGEAANGDVAATNYAADYQAELVGEEELDGQRSYRLILSARHNQVTYPRIEYWVAVDSGLALRAEFYTVSGRAFKAARFEYGNQIDYEGQRLAFVSRMAIEDRVNPGRVTTLRYSDVEAVRLPRRTFDLNALVR